MSQTNKRYNKAAELCAALALSGGETLHEGFTLSTTISMSSCVASCWEMGSSPVVTLIGKIGTHVCSIVCKI